MSPVRRSGSNFGSLSPNLRRMSHNPTAMKPTGRPNTPQPAICPRRCTHAAGTGLWLAVNRLTTVRTPTKKRAMPMMSSLRSSDTPEGAGGGEGGPTAGAEDGPPCGDPPLPCGGGATLIGGNAPLPGAPPLPPLPWGGPFPPLKRGSPLPPLPLSPLGVRRQREVNRLNINWDYIPVCGGMCGGIYRCRAASTRKFRSEEHTSELQSQSNL